MQQDSVEPLNDKWNEKLRTLAGVVTGQFVCRHLSTQQTTDRLVIIIITITSLLLLLLLLLNHLRGIAAAASESNYSYAFVRTVVCLSVSVVCRLPVTFVPLLKPFDGFRCHFAGTLLGSNDTLC